jgi:splicing factor U2AF 35 kDa subunit
VKFSDEEDAETAVQALNGRYYAGRVLKVEYSPVTDFREARCRQYDEGTCGRGHYCNFMHVKEPAKELRKHLEKVHLNSYSFIPNSATSVLTSSV